MLIIVPAALAWEYAFPLILPYSTSDPLDVIAYILGTLTYYLSVCRSTDREEVNHIEK